MGLDTGAFTHFIYAFNPRETIYDICEALCGARLTNSYTRVGGLMRDITPRGDPHDPRPAGRDAAGVGRHGAAAGAEPHLHRPHARAWACSAGEEAINRGVAAGRWRGPAASPATSAATSPIWPTPISISRSAVPREGDCLARYRVRMAEMWESIKIIDQAPGELARRTGERGRPTPGRSCRPRARSFRPSRG